MGVVTVPDSDRNQILHDLVEQYQVDLLRMCYMYLHDVTLAEDALQETYIKAYRALENFVELAP